MGFESRVLLKSALHSADEIITFSSFSVQIIFISNLSSCIIETRFLALRDPKSDLKTRYTIFLGTCFDMIHALMSNFFADN